MSKSKDAKVKRLPVDELTRLAFVWAEQDRSSLADAWPAGSPERAKCESQYQQLKAYRTKRWGRTRQEQIFETAKPVNVNDLKAS